MAYQASVNGRHERDHGHAASASTDLVSDIATLVELHARLAAIESREAARAAGRPLIAVAVGLVLLVGAVPVALHGTARLLAIQLGINQGWSMLLTAAATIVVAAIAVGMGAAGLRDRLPLFRRSREELRRNVAWTRALLSGKRSSYHQR